MLHAANTTNHRVRRQRSTTIHTNRILTEIIVWSTWRYRCRLTKIRLVDSLLCGLIEARWRPAWRYRLLTCLTQLHSYGILYPRPYRAASSMAEQGTLNAKVQGSTPWQPTFFFSIPSPRVHVIVYKGPSHVTSIEQERS